MLCTACDRQIATSDDLCETCRKPVRRHTDPADRYDREVSKAARTVLTARNVWQRGIYKPSMEAKLALRELETGRIK